MKPTWIVLLLVSFTFLHTETQEISAPSTNEQINPTKPTPSTNDSENQPTTTVKSDDGASTAKAVTEPPVKTSEVKPTGKETVNGSSINDHGSSTPVSALEGTAKAVTTTTTTTTKTMKTSTVPTAPGSVRNDTGNDTSAGLGGQAAPTQGKDTVNGSSINDHGSSTPGKDTVNGSSINDHGSSTPGSGTDSKTTNKTDDTKGQSPSGQGENDLQSGQNADGETKQQETDRRILWILLPVLGVLVAGVLFVLKFKCMKVQDHAEPTENGTENASFQRSDSNKDGVMLLGVKTSGGEENMAAR
ncbi:cell wall protein DAN4-like isoform X2 [Alosa sapidissima]|uniref:cell wall protein DAN4-like isoform X2 n=1 Tax=Alosa sapidissima TaxID=34773 RepID=UPI001C082925|nr:cell wall protein DAN4-like isoform X2 [Alosa sapidissima]